MRSVNLFGIIIFMGNRKPNSIIKKASEFGIDITLLYRTLSLTPTERMEWHQKLLEASEELRKAGERKHKELEAIKAIRKQKQKK